MDPVFHNALRRRVTPVWPILYKSLRLPEFLFGGSKLPLRLPSQSKARNTNRRDSSPHSIGSGSVQSQQTPGGQSSQGALRPGFSTQSLSAVRTILDVLRIFAKHKFVCLVLDDVHLADDESIDLISQIISTRINMVLIIAYRPECVVSDQLKRLLETQQSEGMSGDRRKIVFTEAK